MGDVKWKAARKLLIFCVRFSLCSNIFSIHNFTFCSLICSLYWHFVSTIIDCAADWLPIWYGASVDCGDNRDFSPTWNIEKCLEYLQWKNRRRETEIGRAKCAPLGVFSAIACIIANTQCKSECFKPIANFPKNRNRNAWAHAHAITCQLLWLRCGECIFYWSNFKRFFPSIDLFRTTF